MEETTLVPLVEATASQDNIPPAPGAEAAKLLREIRDHSREQTRIAKAQMRLTGACAIMLAVTMAAVLIFVFTLIPRINETLEMANSVFAELQVVTGQLQEADLGNILKNVDDLVLQSQESMAKALKDVESALRTIEGIDIPKLNSAIDGLYRVVHPFESLFGK